ncbi:hypothetical protein, conserved [Trypanosoma brucei brucei TREU927]|uniref:MYND-type domain-containing protein n=1 Tax=Trypanosoma brucei brucei (strain 927/4 GUTat10.1) TaxID=185431 RepID=Q38CK6_TRYB2|nr:hypothetical protein, conserved [Trypanosoma brucei brucei TREU927]EAN77464.1 hypothetical protein, conserved [Trypanosoma brucei brucei TREU927]
MSTCFCIALYIFIYTYVQMLLLFFTVFCFSFTALALSFKFLYIIYFFFVGTSSFRSVWAYGMDPADPTASECDKISSIVSRLEMNEKRQHELMLQISACEARIRAIEAHMSRNSDEVPKKSLDSQVNDRMKTDDRKQAVAVTEERICDYCLIFTQCWSCPACGREWYCSSRCQRLRTYLHGPFCGCQRPAVA